MCLGNLAGRVAVITGAREGIGRAVAQALGSHGATVYAASRSAARLELAGIPELQAFEADFTDDSSVEAWIERLSVAPGGLDFLIHSAGSYINAPVDQARIEDFDSQYRVNVRSPYRITQALLPRLKASRGQIVFVNSSACQGGREGLSQYAATKAALRAMADCLRQELNSFGIRVLSIYPGRTATPLQERLHRDQGLPWQPSRLAQPQDIADAIVQSLLLPETAEITDVFIRSMAKGLA
jgi:NAD(P)-dependent dehydrogenase (short-subunit alcohol dehydrogenase family)